MCELQFGGWFSTVIMILAGFPSGFIISAFFGIIFRYVFDDGGMFINYSGFRDSLTNLISNAIEDKNYKPSSKKSLVKFLALLKNEKYPARVFFACIWDVNSPERLQQRSHRRLESFHTVCGIIISLFLAIMLAIIYYCVAPNMCFNAFLKTNWLIIIIGVAISLLLYIYARGLATDVGNQENTWMQLILTNYSDDPAQMVTKLFA